MYLVDSSVWINHLRDGNPTLVQALSEDAVWCHPHIIGELALGSLKERSVFLEMLGDLPRSTQAADNEVIALIENRKLYGRGIGYIDCHLLASALIAGNLKIWSDDKRLSSAAAELGVAAHPLN